MDNNSIRRALVQGITSSSDTHTTLAQILINTTIRDQDQGLINNITTSQFAAVSEYLGSECVLETSAGFALQEVQKATGATATGGKATGGKMATEGEAEAPRQEGGSPKLCESRTRLLQLVHLPPEATVLMLRTRDLLQVRQLPACLSRCCE